MKSLLYILVLLLVSPIQSISQISSTQVITTAESYLNYTWTANSNNIWNNVNCGGKTVNTPNWVTVGTHTTMPYCWGGNSMLSEFNSYLNQGKSAGDDNTATGYGAEPSCAVGVDCSGFLSRCYGLSNHYSTTVLNNHSLFGHYSSFSQLQVGDFVNKPGSHTRLIKKINANGTFSVIESGSGTGNVGAAGLWQVFSWTYTLSQLSQYNPQYYKNMNNSGGNSLDCSSAINLTCGITYYGSSSSATSSVESYGCNTWTETGPERVHEIISSANGTLTATISNFSGDLDVYILGSCDPNDCLGTVTPTSASYTNAQANTTYYIVVDADDGSGSSYDLIVTCPAGSSNSEDITVTNTTVSPLTIQAGGVVDANCDQNYTGNQSRADLPPFDLHYYLSVDCNLDNNDVFLDDDVSTIGSDDTSDPESADLTIPSGTTPGNYYILFVGDANNELNENNENNNVSCVSITVTSTNNPNEDITVTNAQVNPQTVAAGDDVSVECDHNYFGNTLDSELPSFDLEYYLSPDCYLSANDVYLDDDVSNLGSDDDSHHETQTVTIPESNVPGQYYILFIGDANDELDESDENNNTACIPITITEAGFVDLAIIDNNFPDSVNINSNSNYYVTIANLGTKSADGYSYDITRNGADIGGGTYNPAFTPNETDQISIPIQLGTTSIEYCVNISHATNETIIANNTFCKTIHAKTLTNIQSLSKSSLVRIYPNPTNGILKIENYNQGEMIQLYDYSGKIVMSNKLYDNSIDLSEFPNGSYVITFTDRETPHTISVVKETIY